MAGSDILNDFLVQLDVPHTHGYTAARYRDMPFKTLFGLSKLLEEYGVENEGLFLADKSELSKLSPPFLAHTGAGLVIVTAIDSEGRNVGYLTQGVTETIPMDRFLKAFDGNVLLAYPQPGRSHEPEYCVHHRSEIFSAAKKWGLVAALLFIFGCFFITNRTWSHVSTVLLTLFNLAGLFFTYLLVQKSFNIHNPTADSVCKVLQEGGCDSVLKTSASSFFGIFSWSEVGFAYFSVSLVYLLVSPGWIGYLALCNACCLPFTFWSIWYQRFRAHAWCTLCVSVQATLWCLFFCYLGGGWFHGIFPLRLPLFIIGATYIAVLLGINRVNTFFSSKISRNENDI